MVRSGERLSIFDSLHYHLGVNILEALCKACREPLFNIDWCKKTVVAPNQPIIQKFTIFALLQWNFVFTSR